MVIETDRSGFPQTMTVVGSPDIKAKVDDVISQVVWEACASGGLREAEKAKKLTLTAGSVSLVYKITKHNVFR